MDFELQSSKHSAPKTEGSGTKGQNLKHFDPEEFKTVLPVLCRITYLLDNLGELLKIENSTSESDIDQFVNSNHSEASRVVLAFVELQFPSGLSIKRIENTFILYDCLAEEVSKNTLTKSF